MNQERILDYALPILKALAAIAALMPPWVRFEAESSPTNGILLLPYTLTHGNQAMLRVTGFPWWGWLATIALCLLLAAVAVMVYRNLTRTGQPDQDPPADLWPSAAAFTATVAYVILASPYLTAGWAYLGLIAPLTVYGWEPARYVAPTLNRLASRLAPHVTGRLRAARDASRDRP